MSKSTLHVELGKYVAFLSQLPPSIGPQPPIEARINTSTSTTYYRERAVKS
jgi:hypothetical protein